MTESYDIYEPAEDSKLLAKFVQEKAIGRVLEIGTGSGIQAITASKSPNVRSTLAVDINPKAVDYVQKRIEEEHLSKIKVIQSDLFENVEGEFETIIFNPPYLPQDYISGEAIVDPALYGGDKGFEIIVKFLDSAYEHLARNGKILLLFSSLSKKDVIDEALKKNLFQFELLAEEKMPMFEILYVYEITALPILESIKAHGVKELKYFAKGKRGAVYKGKWDINSHTKKFLAPKNMKDVAIKIKLDSSTAPGTIEMEALALREVNKKGIGPKLYHQHNDFIIREFVDGVHFDKFIDEMGVNDPLVKSAILQLLEQAFTLDSIGQNKEEMHRPHSNVLVTLIDGKEEVKVTLIDFERCRKSDNPQNVTQLISFLMKRDIIPKEDGISVAEEYKENYSRESFEKLLTLLK